MWIYKLLIIGVLSTLVCELIFAIICKVSRRDLQVVALANFLTNPVVVLCFYLLFGVVNSQILLIAILEISAVAVEYIVYKTKTNIKAPALFVIFANAISFGLGLLIF